MWFGFHFSTTNLVGELHCVCTYMYTCINGHIGIVEKVQETSLDTGTYA